MTLSKKEKEDRAIHETSPGDVVNRLDKERMKILGDTANTFKNMHKFLMWLEVITAVLAIGFFIYSVWVNSHNNKQSEVLLALGAFSCSGGAFFYVGRKRRVYRKELNSSLKDLDESIELFRKRNNAHVSP